MTRGARGGSTRRAGKNLIEALAIVREVDAPRLATFDRALRGDLETIVMHALEKDRARRFCDTKLTDAKGESLYADLLFTVIALGRAAYIFLLLEHKSEEDPKTALQILRYIRESGSGTWPIIPTRPRCRRSSASSSITGARPGTGRARCAR